MADAFTRIARSFSVPTRPADAYGDFDSEHAALVVLRDSDPDELARRLDVSTDIAALAIRADREDWAGASAAVIRAQPELLGDFRRVHANAVHTDEFPLHITDVTPGGPVMSDADFTLVVRFQNAGDAPLAIASVQVSWAGDPFVVEQETRTDERDGAIEISFGGDHHLPVGPVEFLVTLLRADGAQSTFRRGAYVLPSNPLALSLGPAGARVTGSWSVRGDYQPGTDTFLTECEITLANGDPRSVTMNRRVTWQFWDGGVGSGTLIESGAFDWSGPISVPASGVWRGGIWFSSPRNSGIFGTYDRKEDMALSVSMTAADGRVVRGEITARVMLAFGVNIIKVGAFGAQEHVDLYDAVDQMRLIYERRDLTLRGVDRRIITDAQAGSYTIVNDEDEFRDLLEDWSCRNDFVDVYVVQDFQWSTYNGYAGDIPGPASKGGRKDGVAVEKTGFTDASGTMRLSVATLSQLIGHEVGHYLGLPHLENTNNLMRSNTGNRGPDLDYDQYRLMFPHGYVFYE